MTTPEPVTGTADPTESFFYGHIDGGMYAGCPCRACAFCRAVPTLSEARNDRE